MISYVNKKLEVKQLTDLTDFYQLVYGENRAACLDTDERLDCAHLFELLCDERIIFYTCNPNDLFSSIGIKDGVESLRHERNIFMAAFLIRSSLNNKAVKMRPEKGLLFVNIKVDEAGYMVSRTNFSYETHPPLNAWVRKIAIDKMLLTI